MPRMAKSIRISDSLYNEAEAIAQKMHRSLAQQVEHWAALGRAVESSGATTPQMIAILNGDLRALERAMLKTGAINPQSMYLFPAHVVAETKIRFPELEK
jgi:hypothetical protein